LSRIDWPPETTRRPIRSASSAGGKIATVIESAVVGSSMRVRMTADVPGGRGVAHGW
jgi:hypothetical protein